ncbi:metallophosphoesterase [Oribacterium sp. NK2B42]|uniref:metallophosphoesterase n=1 Tax=Oribacterium sp. NK2B42 TaxID=689781 RepID=UPI00041821E2|nr:metallophosphoesterase [Oribacterium sp. NK2B42]
MKKVIIGDVHGCYEELLSLLDQLKINLSVDKLIFVGDLIDRGQDSFKVLQLIKSLKEKNPENIVYLRGNHEQMMLDCVLHNTDYNWLRNGADATMASFDDVDLMLETAKWIECNTVFYYEDPQFIAAHAFYDESYLSSPFLIDRMIWDRTHLERNLYSGKLLIIGHTPLKSPIYQIAEGTISPIILPYNMEMDIPQNGMIDLDTACTFGNKLTAMIIEDDKFYLAKEEAFLHPRTYKSNACRNNEQKKGVA